MALGDADIAFLISSGIMLTLFIFIYHKLYKKPEISRMHKVVYAILFPGIVILIGIGIFVFQIFINWREVLMFNVAWIPLFLLMLSDLAGDQLTRKIPFGKVFLTVGLIVLLIFCLTFILIDFLWYISVGVWLDFLPLPIFIVLVLGVGPLFVLTARLYGKGEEEFTDGRITSGGILFLYIIILTYGLALFVFGTAPIVFGEDSWLPPYLSRILLVIGILLMAVSLPKLIEERRKRKEAGYA